ncbi:MAG: hypothetical protein Q7T80_18000, partial [Methanoregula sp.]|nr:hypothetical protein [Methanoregula sp.]
MDMLMEVKEMETKWIIAGFLLICVIISTVVVMTPMTKTPISLGTQGSTSDFILEKELPKSQATAPFYNVVKKEAIYEGSPKVMEIKTSIPSENEAPIIAEKILEKYGGLPEDAVLSRVEQVSIEKY